MKYFKYIFFSILFTGCLFAAGNKNLPGNVEKAIDEIIATGENNANTTISGKSLKILSDFIISSANDKNVWQVKPRREANGAALIKAYKIPIEKVLKISFASKIPDAAVFYNILRYSKKINLSQDCKKFFANASNDLKTNEIIESSYLSVEGIAPNVQSGAYYSYTNLRTVTRANINGVKIFVSISDMIGPSVFSMRGVPVGNVEDGVFYYSQKPGMNMTGVSWLKSQMYLSSTIAVYLETPDNGTAVAMFSWQKAGWKGMNVVKNYHIYNVLQDTFNNFHRVLGNEKVNLKNMMDIIDKVNNMNRKEKNALFNKYCDYVRTWKNKKPNGLNPFRKSQIAKIFNEKSLENMNSENKNIIIIQEFVRALIGKPTWSVPIPLKIAEKK